MFLNLKSLQINLDMSMRLCYFFLVLLALVSNNLEANPSKSKRVGLTDILGKYESLLPLWQEGRKQFAVSSNTHDYWNGKYGKAIIALGPAILPTLIRQVKGGDFFFNVPLEAITGLDISNGKSLSEQEKSKLWIAWWELK